MQNTPIESIEIPVGLANEISQYLSQRPYIEVSGLIGQLQGAAALSVANQKANQAAAPTDPAAPDEITNTQDQTCVKEGEDNGEPTN